MNKLKSYLLTLESLLFLVLLALFVILTFLFQVFVFIFTFPYYFYDNYYIHKLGNRVLITLVHFASFYINIHWKCEPLTDLPSRDPKNRVILMINHMNLADAIVTTTLSKRFYSTYLYKDALHRIYPKPMLHLIGQVPIYFHYDKDKKTKSIKKDCVLGVMERCKTLMDNGFDLFVFPEGTRSRTGKLQEFKDGFFRFSVDNGYDIIPCAVHNTKDAVYKPLCATSRTLYIMAGSPVSPKGKTVEELKFEVRKKVYNLIKMSPTFDPSTEIVEELE
ncbi:1-acylglycerol-3-phosphate O-acyltransferase, putative [Theileria annulata]|uniref:1-acylglycerol-3-phosphate O-acyltransferase, putative n=1 Tax=Theileria annulata TaxID=5874 RepID=Q4UF24_THEAN|nr:1-acylglycerol-3-phosphate O-acyltransferase, putative [Theileria annulata]CAI74315.1 1-acylglycerol-3-phosphate O-acyltransferase, putative [Theileria annulata]|eukprot:XP_952047.1 1-acylglycerol-3-phosphate O-acyltransferase, putative [Theileria annulata]